MSQTPNIGSLVGTWAYRSFLNDPDLSTDFDALEFGRGTITIQEARWAFSSDPSGARAGLSP